jgi:hypothetical protein
MIARRDLTVDNPSAIVGFERNTDGRSSSNDYLTISGRRVIDLGFDCPSCTRLFERVDPLTLPMSPHDFSTALRDGMTELDGEILDVVRSVVPSGQYTAALLPIRPRLVLPGAADDYFANEYRRSTNRDKNPGMVYYRGRSTSLAGREHWQAFHELCVPLYPPEDCARSTVEMYRSMLASGGRPTALAISIIDGVALSHWSGPFEPNPPSQLILTHYLLDGHHKVFAAHLEHREIQLLSLVLWGKGRPRDSYEHLHDTLFGIFEHDAG